MSLWTGKKNGFWFPVLEALMKQGNKVIEMIKGACASKKMWLFGYATISLSSTETVISILVSPKKETMLQALLCNPKFVKAYLN